jgi:hypothetical protein
VVVVFEPLLVEDAEARVEGGVVHGVDGKADAVERQTLLEMASTVFLQGITPSGG